MWRRFPIHALLSPLCLPPFPAPPLPSPHLFPRQLGGGDAPPAAAAKRLDISLSGEIPTLTRYHMDNASILTHLSSCHLSPNGEQVVLTSRGHVAVIGSRSDKNDRSPLDDAVDGIGTNVPLSAARFAVDTRKGGGIANISNGGNGGTGCTSFSEFTSLIASTPIVVPRPRLERGCRRAFASFGPQNRLFFQSDESGSFRGGMRLFESAVGAEAWGMTTLTASPPRPATPLQRDDAPVVAGAAGAGAGVEDNTVRVECVPSPTGRFVAYHTRTHVMVQETGGSNRRLGLLAQTVPDPGSRLPNEGGETKDDSRTAVLSALSALPAVPAVPALPLMVAAVTGSVSKIDSDVNERFAWGDLTWSQDGRFLLFAHPSENHFLQVHLFDAHAGAAAARAGGVASLAVPLTSDAFNCFSPQFAAPSAVPLSSDKKAASSDVPKKKTSATADATPTLEEAMQVKKVGGGEAGEGEAGAGGEAGGDGGYEEEEDRYSVNSPMVYFLSERAYESLAGHPFGPSAPMPFCNKEVGVYKIIASGGATRSGEAVRLTTLYQQATSAKQATSAVASCRGLDIGLDAQRVTQIATDNYDRLKCNAHNMVLRRTEGSELVAMGGFTGGGGGGGKADGRAKTWKAVSLCKGVIHYELRGGRLLVRSAQGIKVVAAAKGGDLTSATAVSGAPLLNLGQCCGLQGGGAAGGESMMVDPRVEWRQMFDEAWRVIQSTFYDPGLHGLDWDAVRTAHLPLVERVMCRSDLNVVIGSMASELSALHMYVYGGDEGGIAGLKKALPSPPPPGSLGCDVEVGVDPAAEGGGLRVSRLLCGGGSAEEGDGPRYRSPAVAGGINAGDVLVSVGGVSVGAHRSLGAALIGRTGALVPVVFRRPVGAARGGGGDGDEGGGGAGKESKGGEGGEGGDGGKQEQQQEQEHCPGQGEQRVAWVQPMSAWQDRELRYRDWEATCAASVERETRGRAAYVHLRAMGGRDYASWHRSFFPNFDKGGLVIDVRHNRGGNIDTWLLDRLLRQAWLFFHACDAAPNYAAQAAFRGHIAVVCNERTASDGEGFCLGTQRVLPEGRVKIFGTRTWGGFIWIAAGHKLVDGGT